MASAAKKAKTDGEKQEEKEELAEKKDGTEGTTEEKEPGEPGPPPELEQDAAANKGAKVKEPVTFQQQDTTMNCVLSAFGSMIMPLTDGGLQFLLAGARASVGVKSGRYMFEVKVLEIMNPAEDAVARQRAPQPRNQLRVGFSVAGSSLFLGDSEDSVCFDMEGALTHNRKKEACSQKFGQGDVVAVLINRDSKSPNHNTISLFKNGVRACQPQALPESLKDKELFPAVTFKNLTFHYNFGPTPLRPLPFVCHMLKDILAKDSALAVPEKPKDGKHEVLFPVALPDEGTFDGLDFFLEGHRQHTELSDRAILAWAQNSGLTQTKQAKTSNDKPEMGFGIPMMDDGSVRRVLNAVAPIQQRSYVVMEVKANLLKDDRKEALAKWGAAGFKRTAAVMMGEPPAPLKKRILELALRAKQEASDTEFKAKKAEEKRKKLLEKRQKQLEKERKKAAKAAKKKQEALRKRLEEEKRKRERAAKGEAAEEEEPKEEPKEEEKDSDEEEKEDEEMEEPEEEPPKVELTAEEKKQIFRKTAVPDMTSYALSTSFTKFSVPDKEEGFDEVRFEWSGGEQCKEYLKQWVRDRKLTTRIEDLQPSEWFNGKFKDWQKTLQAWHAKQNQHKALLAKRTAEAAAKKAAAEKAAALAKAKAEKEKAEKEKAEKEGKDGAEENEEEEEKKEEEEEEEKAPEAAPAEEDKKEEPAVDFDKLDVFGVEDILDIGGGQPLFSAFAYEDWAMMGLRFEIYLLTHAFRRDVNDPDRVGIHLEHLGFYYNRYYKKMLNLKMYGVETWKELLDLIKDTVVICGKNQVVKPMLPDDMESLGVFAMITEESRRDRLRRVNLGDASAALKMSQQPVPGAAPAGLRPAGVVGPGARPVVPALAGVAGAAGVVAARPPVAAGWQRPVVPPFGANGSAGAFRPPVNPQVRPGAWRGFVR